MLFGFGKGRRQRKRLERCPICGLRHRRSDDEWLDETTKPEYPPSEHDKKDNVKTEYDYS